VTDGFRCANCGEPAGPRFCGHCGQEVAARRGALAPLLGELFSEWFSLDGVLPRTVGMLARPGRLTRAYLAGRRARYLRPLRLYFVASLVLFSSALDLPVPDVRQLDVVVAGTTVHEADDGERRGKLEFFTSTSWLTRGVLERNPERFARLLERPAQDLATALFAGLERVLPTALILFLPFLALALKLLYVRTGTLYVDHLVFAVHFQSALFLGLAAVWLVTTVARLHVFVAMLGYVAVGLSFLGVYLPLALRRVYRQGGGWTALKTLALVLAYAKLLQFVVELSMLTILWSL
jgi:hypothetical protein